MSKNNKNIFYKTLVMSNDINLGEGWEGGKDKLIDLSHYPLLPFLSPPFPFPPRGKSFFYRKLLLNLLYQILQFVFLPNISNILLLLHPGGSPDSSR